MGDGTGIRWCWRGLIRGQLSVEGDSDLVIVAVLFIIWGLEPLLDERREGSDAVSDLLGRPSPIAFDVEVVFFPEVSTLKDDLATWMTRVPNGHE